MLLPPPPECWDHRCPSPPRFYAVPGTERSLAQLDKQSLNWPSSQALVFSSFLMIWLLCWGSSCVGGEPRAHTCWAIAVSLNCSPSPLWSSPLQLQLDPDLQCSSCFCLLSLGLKACPRGDPQLFHPGYVCPWKLKSCATPLLDFTELSRLAWNSLYTVGWP